MRQLLSVGIGGFIGSTIRYILYINFNKIHGSNFPIGTLLVNIIGCFFIGLLFNSDLFNNQKYAVEEFVIIGILGGFTTFSAFGMETYNLIKNELLGTALLYIFLSIIFGLIAIYISSKFNGNIWGVINE